MFRIWNVTHLLFPKRIDPIHVMDFIDFHRFSSISIVFLLIFIDVHRFPLVFKDFHGFSRIFINFHRFTWISIVFHGFERFCSQNVGRPLPPCAALWQPVVACGGLWRLVAACGSGFDPLI